MLKIDIAGLKIDAISKQDLMAQLAQRIKNNEKTFLTTPYSEFLFACLQDNRVLPILNQANFAVADGIGIFWAAKYLSIPLSAKNYWLKILQACWQASYTLFAILFRPKYIKSMLPEKISGSDLIWDLAKMAAENGWSIYLLGGFGDTAKLTADQLISRSRLPQPELSDGGQAANQLKISGWSNKSPDDPTIIEDIKNTKPDLLFVAYGPIKQERWISQKLPNLPIKLAIGLGGTFDYIAKKRSSPPKFIRNSGLEWLFRLFTQPHRIGRICNAFFGLIFSLVHYKVFQSYPMRRNGVGVILNNQGKIFLARKIHSGVDIQFYQSQEKWKNYWQFPQGGLEEKEDLAQAVQREVKEETGINDLKLIYISAQTNSYIWNNAVRKFWHNRKYLFKGQTQHIAYFKYTGDDKAIRLPKKEEFCEYQWVLPEKLEETLHKDRKPLAKIVFDDLAKGLIKID